MRERGDDGYGKDADRKTGGPRYRPRGTEGELCQPRFFDRALRTVKEYHEKVEYIHLSPVRAGLVSRPQDWPWSSPNEYVGIRPEEQLRCCALTIDRVIRL